VTWYYDRLEHAFRLSISSQDRYNDSCSCHPEWRFHTHYSNAKIPADEISPDINDPASWDDHFNPQAMPCFEAAVAAREEARAAAKRAEEEAARVRKAREDALQKRRDEREFERLREKLGRSS
jgi:hypothetical protein